VAFEKGRDRRAGEKPDRDSPDKSLKLSRYGKREQDIADAVRANDQDVHRHGM
jgi:hypothetical protein